MTYHLEIKETAESKAIIEHLLSLEYVKVIKPERKPLTQKEIADSVKKSEKSKRISWSKAKKEIASWK